MSYTLSQIELACPPVSGLGQVQEQASEKCGSEKGGQDKVLLVLLLFAAYMNLLINLMRVPNGKASGAVR